VESQHNHVKWCSQFHHDQLDELSMLLLIVLYTFTQFQVEFFDTRQIVLYSVKGMRIKKYQIFIQLHDVALIDSVEQGIKILLDLMRVFDSIEVEINLSCDIGCDEPYNLILLAINNKVFLIFYWIWNHNFCIFPQSISL
jgi:hypothetical protein